MKSKIISMIETNLIILRDLGHITQKDLKEINAIIVNKTR